MASEENDSAHLRKSNQKSVTKKQSRIYTNPFLNFIRDLRKLQSQEMQGQIISQTQLSQMAGQRWREMTPEQRQPYIDLAQQARKSIVVGKSGKKIKGLKKNGKKTDKKETLKEKKLRKTKEDIDDKNTKKCAYCGSYYKRSNSNDKLMNQTSASSRSQSYTSVTSAGSGR